MASGAFGIVRRHGGAFGVTGRMIRWIAILTAVTAFGSWFWGPWLTSLAIGAVLLAIGLARSDIAPRFAGWIAGLRGPFAAGSAWAFEIFGSGEVSLGDDITSLFMAAGLAIYSIGLFLIGIWLKSEEVVDEPELTATA